MSGFSIEDFDSHIRNLQSQLEFLTEALDTTDSATDPEWLDADLIALKGKTSMLCDDMRRVRKRMAAEGIRTGHNKGNKRQRLSIEGAAASNGDRGNSTPGSNRKRNGDMGAQPTPPAKPPRAAPAPGPSPAPEQDAVGHDFQVQYVDVTEEVNRRLRESRLRQLMDSPSTSQKRKRDLLDEEMDIQEQQDEDEGSDQDSGRSPTKKARASGTFKQLFKANEASKRDVNKYAWDEGRPERSKDEVKRRRL